MDIPLLEQLARQLSQGRRDALHLVDAVGGRYRERAVLQESVRPPQGATTPPNRLLCGDPALALAALLSEGRLERGPAPDLVIVDLRPASDDGTGTIHYAQWIPALFLVRVLAPDAIGRVLAPRGAHAALRLLLDAAWPNASIGDDATDATAPNVIPSGNQRAPVTLLLAQHAARCVSHVSVHDRWVAVAPDVVFAAHVRRACIADGASVDIAVVGAAPGEWTRRHAGGKALEAMQAALQAFGATPLTPGALGNASPSSRRRAGTSVLLGECVREGERTLVWVDAPDRRTNDASLCRAITRRDFDAQAWDRLVVLGWHFAPTFAQHLALRSDTRLDAFAVSTVPRQVRRGVPFEVDPGGFRRVSGLAGAWIDRARSRRAPGFECLTVSLQSNDIDACHAIEDWSIDPDHTDDVFRGAWHGSRDGVAGLHSARLRVPWRAGPRRVCVRAFHAGGGISDVILVVRHRPETECDAASCVRTTPSRRAVAEALC